MYALCSFCGSLAQCSNNGGTSPIVFRFVGRLHNARIMVDLAAVVVRMALRLAQQSTTVGARFLILWFVVWATATCIFLPDTGGSRSLVLFVGVGSGGIRRLVIRVLEWDL